MCTDYKNINKAYSKDTYLLLSVNGATEHKVLSFLDAYLGYNQIRTHKGDKEKTVHDE